MALINVDEAHKRLMQLFSPVGVEDLPLVHCGGRVLAKDVVAERSQPPFPASAMDGYAVHASDLTTGARLTLIGTSAAGNQFEGVIRAGEAVRIFTGAPVPDGADRILIQEDAHIEDGMVVVGTNPDAANYIRPAGGDFHAGARMSAPRRLTSRDIALAAAMNQPTLTVSRRPVVAVMPTGEELVAPGETLRADQIVSSNNYGLSAMLQSAGADVRMMPIAGDTIDSLEQVFELASRADAIVTLGGASVGDHDLVQKAAIRSGLELEFHRIAMRPGKPLMAGRFGGTPFLGLPGNPVSAMVCARLFLLPAVDTMMGLQGSAPQRHSAKVEIDLPSNGEREHYMRALVRSEGTGWQCRPFQRQDSSLLSVLAESNALMVRPRHDPAKKSGDTVEFLWF